MDLEDLQIGNSSATILNISTTAPIASSDWQEIRDVFYVTGYVITPMLLVIGLFGNSITIATMTSREFSNLTSRYILIFLAISDTTLILAQPFNKLFLRKLIKYDARALSDGGCKFFFLIFRTAKMTSSWLIVILCIERFVSIMFPLKAKRIITKKTILAMIVLDYAIIGTYNAAWTFSSKIINGVCKPDAITASTKQKYQDFLFIGLSFYSIIPMLIMAFLTIIIVIKLLSKKRVLRAAVRQGVNTSTKEIKASIILISIVVAFIVLVLPITVVFFISVFRNVSAFDTNTLDFFIFREIAQILEQVNYSINFFMYILCSDNFRKKAFQRLGFVGSRVAPVPQGSNGPGSSLMTTRPLGDSQTRNSRVTDSLSEKSQAALGKATV